MPYDVDSGKVKEFCAWLIRPNGDVKKYDKKETLDVAASLDDVYNDTRRKVIDATADADVGAVFGYQYTIEKRELFAQDTWLFQSRLPVLLSRYTLALPAGWRASSVTFNHAKIEPVVNNSSYTWELRDIPPIVREPASPEVTDLAPRLAVSFAPADASPALKSFTYANWTDVSRWYSNLSDAQSEIDDSIAQKARELTANSKTELEKIQAVGRYVQNLQYISIQIGIGGYRPHAAPQVLAKGCGDCKDKANLMRAMLKALKIQSYLVLIYSGDPSYVREEWASPTQFNHCIIAVKVSDETNAPTVIKHPTLGRLLIFDATDDATPVGDLPSYEQGSFALIAAGDSGSLVRMPVTPPDLNRIERTADVTLAADGSMSAKVSERAFGQAAKTFRREFKELSRPEYNSMIERWVTRGVSGAKIAKIEPADNHAEGRFALDVEFTSPSFARTMRGNLIVFKPAIVSRRDGLFLTEERRKYPVLLQQQAYNETVRVKIPAGFAVDEIPDATKLETPFGVYSATYELQGDQLIFKRALTLRGATIPAERYKEVRDFFGRVLAAEQSLVALAKK